MHKKTIFIFLLTLIIQLQISFSQHYYLPLNREWNLRYEPYLYRVNSDMHTAVRPFISSEVARNAPLDSLDSAHVKDCKFNHTFFGRKLRKEHLLNVKGEDYNIYLDPVFEFEGNLINSDNNKFTYENTRGIWVSGNIGERFSFSSSFYESQAKFPDYIDSAVRQTHVVPGGARPKNLYSSFDYDIAYGTISYSLKKYFNFQFGNDKVFIGDGYRSLLLSDNAFNYPFLKITTTIWKVKYVNLFTAMQDLQIPSPPGYPIEDFSFRKKYGSFHFLDVNIGKRLSVGILEAIIWKSDSVRAKSFDINYINPFIFFRPVEFSLGSSDNAMIGINMKYKISNSNLVYGQLMLDEFKISEVRSGNGWWANKQSVQFGFKSYNLFVPNLHLLTEINFVRPYTYQHRSSLTNYGHYNQSITHPLGANFWESVSILSYKYKNFYTEVKISYVEIGYDLKDSSGTYVNYGQNIFESYETHPNEYGNSVGQGLNTKQLHSDFKIGYLVNPKTNLVAEGGVTDRMVKNIYGNHQTLFFYFGIKTSLTNRYFDF